MPTISNSRVLFNKIPDGLPIPGEATLFDTSQTIDLESVPLNGGILVKVIALSVDPYQRGRMRTANKKSYSPPYTLGEPIDGYGVGTVLRSEHDKVKAGDIVYGLFPFQEYFIGSEAHVGRLRVLHNEHKIPLHTYVGCAGMPGKTAVFGWKAYVEGKAKPKGTLFVTTAAGAVGSIVVQIAKKEGLKVIGSAGSDAKVDFLKSIGCDVAFNYKTTDTRHVLEREGPIDVYWDHVGGDTLEAGLDNMTIHGIVLIVGAISQYNSAPKPPKNFSMVLTSSLTIQGLLVGRHEAQFAEEFYSQMPKDIAEGKIKFLEQKYNGLSLAPQAIYDVQTGNNWGKAVVILGDDNL